MIPYRRWGPYTIPTEAQRMAFHQRYEFPSVSVFPTAGTFLTQPAYPCAPGGTYLTPPHQRTPPEVTTNEAERCTPPGTSQPKPSHSSPTISSSTPRQLSPPNPGGAKTCLICGDRATGLHYGIVSCEGCKGFFKRSICNRRVYKCMKDKNCMMSRHKRNRCQYCRLLKCLQVGMNRKAIREDGMPGGRNKCTGPVNLTYEEIERIMTGDEYTIYKQSEQMRSMGVKSPTSDGGSPGSMSSGSGDLPFDYLPVAMIHGSPGKLHPGPVMQDLAMYPRVAEMKHGRIARPPENPSRVEENREAEVSLLPEVEGLLAAEPEVGVTASLRSNLPTDRPITYSELFQFLCRLMDAVLHREIDWVKRVPFARTLSIQSTTGMLTDTWLDAFLLAALRGHPEELFGGLAGHLANYAPQEAEVQKFGHAGLEVMDMARDLATRYQQLNLTLQEHLCLKVVNFLNPDVRFMTDAETVQALRRQYYLVLHDHVQLNINDNTAVNRFRDILSLLPDIKVISRKVGDMSFECIPLLFKAMMHACGSPP